MNDKAKIGPGWKLVIGLCAAVNGFAAYGGLVLGLDKELGLLCAALFGVCVLLIVAGILNNWWEK